MGGKQSKSAKKFAASDVRRREYRRYSSHEILVRGQDMDDPSYRGNNCVLEIHDLPNDISIDDNAVWIPNCDVQLQGHNYYEGPKHRTPVCAEEPSEVVWKETVLQGPDIVCSAGLPHDHYQYIDLQDLDKRNYEDMVKILDTTNYEDMVVIFKPVLLANVDVRQILPHVPFIDHDKVGVIAKRDRRAAVVYLLDELHTSHELGKWRQFMYALETSGYRYIVELLRGQTVIDHTYQIRYIRIISPEIRRRIDPSELLVHLASSGVLSDSDTEEIRCRQRNYGMIDAADLLLDRIPKMHPHWYRYFVDALKDANMTDVAEMLDLPELMDSHRPEKQPPSFYAPNVDETFVKVAAQRSDRRGSYLEPSNRGDETLIKTRIENLYESQRRTSTGQGEVLIKMNFDNDVEHNDDDTTCSIYCSDTSVTSVVSSSFTDYDDADTMANVLQRLNIIEGCVSLECNSGLLKKEIDQKGPIPRPRTWRNKEEILPILPPRTNKVIEREKFKPPIPIPRRFTPRTEDCNSMRSCTYSDVPGTETSKGNDVDDVDDDIHEEVVSEEEQNHEIQPDVNQTHLGPKTEFNLHISQVPLPMPVVNHAERKKQCFCSNTNETKHLTVDDTFTTAIMVVPDTCNKQDTRRPEALVCNAETKIISDFQTAKSTDLGKQTNTPLLKDDDNENVQLSEQRDISTWCIGDVHTTDLTTLESVKEKMKMQLETSKKKLPILKDITSIRKEFKEHLREMRSVVAEFKENETDVAALTKAMERDDDLESEEYYVPPDAISGRRLAFRRRVKSLSDCTNEWTDRSTPYPNNKDITSVQGLHQKSQTINIPDIITNNKHLSDSKTYNDSAFYSEFSASTKL